MKKFRAQKKNANKHSDRGSAMLSASLTKDGFIGAITTAADGEVFDGSLRLETALPLLGQDPIIVRSDGTRPIIHIREDIATAEDERAIRLSVAANRVAEVSLDWDSGVLEEWDNAVGLGDYWADDEPKPWDEEDDNDGVPNFHPVGEDEQGRLDEIAPKELSCTCPSCGHEFIQEY
jgi:hypothetical protein